MDPDPNAPQPIELPAAIDKLDAVPEQFRGLYRKQGDLFVAGLKAGHGYGVDAIDNMRRQLAELGDKHSRATGKLKLYEDEDGNLLDADEIRELLKARKTGGGGDNGKGGNPNVEEQLKALEGQLGKKHQTEVAKLQQRLEHVLGQLRKHVVTNAALAALSKHKANADLLLPHVERFTKVEEAEGEFVARVLDDDGRTTRISRAQGKTGPMAIDEFVEMLREKFPEAYPSTQRTGSGSEGGGGQGGGGNGMVKIPRDRPYAERKRMRDEAVKAGRPYTYED
jgi:hypothetical protein